MGREELSEIALNAGIGVVNTRFPRPAIIEPSKSKGAVLFMPSTLSDDDVDLIHTWIIGLQAQEVA